MLYISLSLYIYIYIYIQVYIIYGTGWETWFEAGYRTSMACGSPLISKPHLPCFGTQPMWLESANPLSEPAWQILRTGYEQHKNAP